MVFQFEDLPDHLLLKIFSYLPLIKGKYSLARVNNRLYDLFVSPQEWKSLSFELTFVPRPLVGQYYTLQPWENLLLTVSNSWSDIILPLSSLPDLQSFFFWREEPSFLAFLCNQIMTVGHDVENFSFILPDHVHIHTFPFGRFRDVENFVVLKMALEHCNTLKNLKITLGKWLPLNYFSATLPIQIYEVIKNILKLIANNSNTLRSVSINSWPVTSEDKLSSILNNLPYLQKLSIFHPKNFHLTQLSLDSSIPQPHHVVLCVQQLQHLTSLSLHCFCISADLLSELSLVKPRFNTKVYPHFTKLSILLVHEDQTKNFFNISLEKWRTLHKSHHDLTMHLSIGNEIPDDVLMSFMAAVKCFKVESVIVSQYGVYSIGFMSILSADFNRLKSFTDYTDGASDLSLLMSLVENCPLLDALVYKGEIEEHCILKLINMRHWKKFKINMSKMVIKALVKASVLDKAAATADSTGQNNELIEPSNYKLRKEEALKNIDKFAKENLRCEWNPFKDDAGTHLH
ncbi:hypothetical protein HELRODRAFT_173442 [Helobdella robusta]|uniref:F-box domain-containing protein n=1 Tax=Helobdella robusta TaxID=6412 RepID=T1F6U0_HELRO|nr:hypothetical protein HELRODRAFT_173442 [Helobdella robusta]ESO03741.1 hypothetical protein HELRODRAFT_173442 [Helobdella robusta]